MLKELLRKKITEETDPKEKELLEAALGAIDDVESILLRGAFIQSYVYLRAADFSDADARRIIEDARKATAES